MTAPNPDAPEPALDITAPEVRVEPPTGLSERELVDWYREQVALRDEDLARLKVALAEREAELVRLARDLERGSAEKLRADIAEGQFLALKRELGTVREQTEASLARADEQLQHAARRIAEAADVSRRSQPPPPVELEDEKVRSAHLVAQLAEVERERDGARRQLVDAGADLEALRGEIEALRAAESIRDERAALAEGQRLAAEERAAAAEAMAASAREEGERLARSEDESRAATVRAAKAEIELRAVLDAARHQLAAGREEQARLRGALEAVRAEVLAKTEELARAHNELGAAGEGARKVEGEIDGLRGLLQREREAGEEERKAAAARMEAERVAAAGRLEQEHAAAVNREQQIAEGSLREAVQLKEMMARDKAAWAEREALLKGALDSAREREASLDAELRVVRSQQAELLDQLADEAEVERRETRAARAETEMVKEHLARAEARAAEAQSVVDSLGRERAALRADAGQMRARVEVLTAAEQRLAQELEDLKGENEFLNQEVARITARPAPSTPPPLPGKAASE